jgi:hypothetical protein
VRGPDSPPPTSERVALAEKDSILTICFPGQSSVDVTVLTVPLNVVLP